MPIAYRSRLLLSIVASLVLAGCGGGASDSATGGTGGSAADAKDEIRLQSTPVDLAAGEEEYLCQYIPPLGKSAWIDRIEFPMLVGFHHVFVFRAKDDPQLSRVPAPCPSEKGVFTNEQLPIASHGVFQAPPGVAFELDPEDGILFQMHLLNASTQPVTAQLQWLAHTIDASEVKHPGGMLRFSNVDIKLPPHEETKVTDSCPMPLDLQMFESIGHYHQLAVDFEATIGGEVALRGVDDKSLHYDPPRSLRAGAPVVWTCDDVNTTTEEVVFGGSLTKNEMCNFTIYGFPIPSSKTLSCR